ncbi:MAG TPA: carboxypeptidase regulatory-like domain-containing protein [Candidatus Acidoferrum sp.]|jgi:hypothetical protein
MKSFGKTRNCAVMILWLVFALVVARPVAAQTDTGNLRGLVTDPSGSAVGNATVIISTATGSATNGTTTSDGVYLIKGLAPGIYGVKVVAQGFNMFEGANLKIVAGQTQTLNVKLTIETQEQKVTVTDKSGAALDVDPAANAGAIVMQGKDLEALSDDPDDLQADLQALAGPSAGPNGGQIYIDGFTGGQLPPKASIREIRINQNPFSAEYDKLGYGRIEILTKPGADQWHGQFMMSGTASQFNSRNPFEALPAGTEPPGYESTQFGGNVGGPLSKKASFFFNYEQRNINNLNVVSATIVDPTTFAITPFSDAVPNPNTRINFSPRIDYQVSGSNTLTARYQYYHQTQDNESVGAFSLASLGTNQLSSESTLQVTDTQNINPKTINETRFQYIHEVANQNPVSTAPEVTVQGAFNTGGNKSGTNDDTQNRYELQNITYINFGAHSLKVGGRLRSTQDENSTDNNFNGVFSFGSRAQPGCVPTAGNNCELTGLQAFQLTLQGQAQGLPFAQIQANGGGPSFFSLSSNGMGRAAVQVSYFDGALFAQDDWRLKPNITLSYGLRYETQNSIGDHADFAPRVGLAWGLGGHAKGASPKTILRLGFGIFYDRFTTDDILTQEIENPAVQQTFLVQNPGFFTPNQATVPTGLVASPQTQYVPNPNLHTPYTIQTGVTVERQLTKVANLSVTYLNSRGNDQFFSNFINAQPLGQPTPSDIQFQYQSRGIFRQNQLIVNTSVRAGAKVSLFGYYVLNYANSDTSGASYVPSDPANPMLDYGRASFDYRHRVFFGGTISLPKGFRLSPFMTASSGPPFNITTGRDLFGDAVFNARPSIADCSGGVTAEIVQTRLGCFNLNPAPGAALIPINDATGDPRFALNLRVSKAFGFGRLKESAGGGQGGPGGPGGPGGFGRGPGGGGPGGGGRGGGGGGGPRGGGGGGFDGGSSARRYTLTFSASARNLFNNVNLAVPIGDLSSPRFGFANGLAAQFASNTANRRIDLQVTFGF